MERHCKIYKHTFAVRNEADAIAMLEEPMQTPEAWPRCPEAAQFFTELFNVQAQIGTTMSDMAAQFLHEAGVNILNLVDHWTLPPTPELAAILQACGLVETDVDGEMVWEHPLARFPRIRLDSQISAPALALTVEDVDHFVKLHELDIDYDFGHSDSAYEESGVSWPAGALAIVARRGYNGFRPGTLTDGERETLAAARKALRNRLRDGEENQVLEHAQQLARELVQTLGAGRATDEFFAAEREYYLSRNKAARWQYEQQQKHGFGWANHDHHTYRSSRQGFRALMQLFLTLGFEMRERFYAGAEAGWGAQILEHPQSRVVIFADVDMLPHELNIDFASTEFAPLQSLGTIGLWCGLHGSSIAQAGMHHLEAEFDFARVQSLLESNGFPVMAPFTDLPMLKQAFTAAEMWPVAPERIHALQAQGSITPEQAAKFLTAGAAGSHLEILQRWDGFKGFNKTGVSNIIRDTDARKTN